mmetsp:Transcript_3704/g.9010  ORF Transcript_3704/g.9010 Transcript_3704/m.9010 type:complete len:108 (-) Transcript_3704:178-501(-)
MRTTSSMTSTLTPPVHSSLTGTACSTPSPLAAFSGTLAKHAATTQCNAVQMLHATGQLDGFDTKLTATGFGDVRHFFLNLIWETDESRRGSLRQGESNSPWSATSAW